MSLPSTGTQGKLVAAMAFSGADTERPTTIVERDLRHGAKDELAHRLDLNGLGKQYGRQPRAHDVGDAAFGGDKAEDAIRRRDEPASEDDPLGVVAVEQIVGRVAGQRPPRASRRG